MKEISVKIKTEWEHFQRKHLRLAKWIYQIGCFFAFSMGVTIFQYLVFTFMPGILGSRLAGIEFMYPQIPMKIFGVEFTLESDWIQRADGCSGSSENRRRPWLSDQL